MGYCKIGNNRRYTRCHKTAQMCPWPTLSSCQRKTLPSTFLWVDFRAARLVYYFSGFGTYLIPPLHKGDRLLDFDHTYKLLKSFISERIIKVFSEPKHFSSYLSTCFPMILKIKWYYYIFTHDFMTCMEGWPHCPQISIFITLQSSTLLFTRWLMKFVFRCHLVLFSECSHTVTSMINISNAIISTAVLIKR